MHRKQIKREETHNETSRKNDKNPTALKTVGFSC